MLLLLLLLTSVSASPSTAFLERVELYRSKALEDTGCGWWQVAQ